jgi:hypothetical protein
MRFASRDRDIAAKIVPVRFGFRQHHLTVLLSFRSLATIGALYVITFATGWA